MIAVVKYQYGCYKSETSLEIDENDSNDDVIVKVKSDLRKRGLLTLPAAYEHFSISRYEGSHVD